MAAEQDVGGIALGLTLETSGWSSGIARAKAELEGLKRSAAGLEIGVGVATRGGARSATAVGGPAVVAGIPGGGVGAASPVISPKFQVSAQSVRQLRVDINAQLRSLGVSGEAVAVPIKLGRVPYATMRTEIATGIGEVPIRIKPDAGSLTAFANVLSAMTGATPGRARQAITAAAASRGIPARAQGGPAAANRPHLVGENGPEIHWPSSSGTYIAPRRAMGGVVSRSPVSRGGGGIDVDEYARWAIERDRRMGGLGRIKVTPDEAGMAHRSMGVHRALRREGMTDPVRLKMHREFYDLERQNIEREAKRIGVTGQQLTHVTAALSSNQPWEDNVRQALIAIKAVQSGSRQAGSFANPEQLGITQAILSGKPVTGIKRLPFAEAFYDPNTFPIDRWMGRITTLGMRRGGDPTGSRMDLMQALRGKDWTTSDVPSPSIRRASVYGIEQMAKEWGIDPREAQAEPWGVIRDLNKEAVKHFRLDKKTGLAMPRARGGGVRPFCSTCGTNIRDPRTHQSTAKHQANARGTSSSRWLSQQPPWAHGYRNQDAQYDPPGFEPNTDWWEGKARGGAVNEMQRLFPNAKIDLDRFSGRALDEIVDVAGPLAGRYPATAHNMRAVAFDPSTQRAGSDSLIARLRSSPWDAMPGMSGMGASSGHRMLFQNRAARPGQELRAALDKQLVTGSSIGGTFAHEFGHAVDYTHGIHPRYLTDQFDTSLLSQYASKGDKGEAFAELFAALETGNWKGAPFRRQAGPMLDDLSEAEKRLMGGEPFGSWHGNRGYRRAKGGPAFKPVKSDAFYSAVAKATQVTRASGRRVGETVHLYGQDEYEGMRTFLSSDGSAGYAIKPDGDLVSVFNVGGPGGGKRALRSAIQRGATKLDAFDEIAPTFAIGKTDPRDTQKNLPRFYERFGFREVGRDPWDPQYAPEGWKGGTPDVVYMERQRKARRALGGAVDYDDISPLKDFDHPIYKAERPGPLLLASWKKAATEHMMGQGWDADDAKQWLANEAASFDMKPTAQAPLRLRTSGAMRDVAGMSSNDNDAIFAQMRADVAIKSKYINSPRGQATLLERAMRPDHNVDPVTRRLPKGVKIRFSPEFSDYPDPSRFIRSGGAGYHGPDWGLRDRWHDPGQLTMGYFQPVVRNMNSLISALAPGGTQPFFEPRGEAEPFRKRWGSLSEWLKQGKWGEDASGFGAGSRARLAAYALDPKNRVLAHTLVEATKQIPQYGPHAGQSIDTLKSDYVWTSPQMRGKGLASAMYSRIEKLTGMPIAPSSSQTPYGRRLWSRPASERSFGRAFGSRSPMPEDAESISMHDRWPSGIDEHGWRSGAEALGAEAFRDFSGAVDPLDRPRRPRRARGQMKLPGFAKGGWTSGDFFGPESGKGFGMMKGRPWDREAVIAWETQLHEGRVGNLTMADIFGGSGSQWRTMGRPDRGPDRNRAEGGDVGKYIIGEIGRELFVPKRMEGIIPPDVAAQIPGTEELLANLMMGRARMSGGGVKEIGGKGSQQWDAPEDGWIIPNRLMHRIARHAGGSVHRHGNRYQDARGRWISKDAYTEATLTANQQRAESMPNQNTAGGSGRALPPTPPAVLSARQAIRGNQTLLGNMDPAFAPLPSFDREAALESARARAYSGATRGLTGRAALGGLGAFFGGGRQRREAAAQAEIAQRELRNLLPKGAEGEPGEFWADVAQTMQRGFKGAKTELEGLSKAGVTSGTELETLNTQLKTFAEGTAYANENLAKVGKLEETRNKALTKAQGGAASNLLAVTAAGFAFNIGMQALQVGLSGAQEVLSPIIDQFSGFTAIGQRVSKGLADALPQAGTLSTLLSQRGATAGLGQGQVDFLSNRVGGGVYAKAGATAADQAGELFRTAISSAPSGLIGGYGGVLGGGLGAQMLGGGKGLLESLSGTYAATRGGPQAAGVGGEFEEGLGVVSRSLGEFGKSVRGEGADFGQVFNPVVSITKEMQEASGAFLTYVNDATERGRAAQGLTGGARLGEARGDEAARVLAIPGLDDYTRQLAENGAVFKDASGNLLTSQKQISDAAQDIARGLTIPDKTVFAGAQAQGLSAQRQAGAVRGALERETLIPGQLGQQIAANPFTSATSGLAEGFKPTLVSLTRIQSLQNEITRDAQAGVEAQAQLVDTELGSTQGAQFRGYMADVSAYGQQIAGLNEQLANRQAQLGLHQFNFQLRVLNRNIRDARGLAGMAGGSRLGGIQREQYDLGRESQRLALESQRLANEMAQRQINFQVAVAGFQAPGITGQERAARMEEAKVEADFAQRQLDIQKRQTGIGGQQFGLEGEAFRIQTAIAVQDLEAQRGILIESHQLEQEQIAVQKQINGLTVRQAQVQAKAQSLFAEATGNFDANLGAASQYVAQFGGTIASALHAVRRAIDVLTGRTTSGTPTQPTTRTPGKKGAAGLIFNTTGETDLTVGEAGGEHVAVLRNPRKVDIGGPGGLSSPGGGGGGPTIQIVVTGNNISSDMDLETITRKVQDAVETGLSRKAGLLSVSVD